MRNLSKKRKIPISVSAALIVLILVIALGFTSCFIKDSKTTTADGPSGFEESPTDTETEEPVIPVAFIENYAPRQSVDFSVYSRRPVEVKGIYVTANRAGIDSYFQDLIDLCNQTEVNAMVIDVKTDKGEVTFQNEIPIADELEVSVPAANNIREVISVMEENDIYPIARIVAFKDNGAWEKKPEWYIKNADGTLWRDSSSLKSAWLNPYNKEAWDYILEVAIAAADIGFKEIQFDYIRFDTSSRLNDADFGDTMGKDKIEIITEFTQYAYEKLRPYGVFVSADVYGTIIDSELDASIVGQDYQEMSNHLDYICPMVYPSHYADGSFGIGHPDLAPYEIIYESMTLSNEKLSETDNPAIVRPWLQGFSAPWLTNYMPYTPVEIKKQIQAVYDTGLSEWIIWNPSVSYNPDCFESEE